MEASSVQQPCAQTAEREHVGPQSLLDACVIVAVVRLSKCSRGAMNT